MTRLLAALAVLINVAACDMAIPPGDARITGGVWPCGGFQLAGPPHYAAANVTVLAGRVAWRPGTQPGGPDMVEELPTAVVATKSVPKDGRYTFTLKPGEYVLQAHYVPVVDGGATPYLEITLHRGDDVNADIPNVCL